MDEPLCSDFFTVNTQKRRPSLVSALRFLRVEISQVGRYGKMIAGAGYMIGSAAIANMEFGNAQAKAPGKAHGFFSRFNEHLIPALKIIGDSDMKVLGE